METVEKITDSKNRYTGADFRTSFCYPAIVGSCQQRSVSAPDRPILFVNEGMFSSTPPRQTELGARPPDITGSGENHSKLIPVS